MELVLNSLVHDLDGNVLFFIIIKSSLIVLDVCVLRSKEHNTAVDDKRSLNDKGKLPCDEFERQRRGNAASFSVKLHHVISPLPSVCIRSIQNLGDLCLGIPDRRNKPTVLGALGCRPDISIDDSCKTML